MVLQHIFDNATMPDCKVNAVAAVCRILMTNPSNVPIENVILFE